ncbi:helix-turn-helix domain-containing protein [Microvirga calopogonii]|uniref:helix-turn-helix domain-containing protein n=1 Tax=Microvirga calopogonii TaxID=2078013 RepID=UPI000E0D00FF|nr:helix-turn-helix domain-containing protein [Microvirga calopogonii]
MIFHPSIFCADFGQQYTIKEVSERMKCSEGHVVALYEDGDLEGIDIARSGAKHRELRFSEEALDAFAERRKGQGTLTAPTPTVKPARACKGSSGAEDYDSWYDN